MGTSVGHWEGSTLVIETTGFDRNGFLMNGVKIGPAARIVERVSLKDEDTLTIARRVVAPAVLTAPSEMTLKFPRDRDHVFHEASHCAQDDRSIDHESGRQRFDLTPPADLRCGPFAGLLRGLARCKTDPLYVLPSQESAPASGRRASSFAVTRERPRVVPGGRPATV
jgi:hypothetical protein